MKQVGFSNFPFYRLGKKTIVPDGCGGYGVAKIASPNKILIGVVFSGTTIMLVSRNPEDFWLLVCYQDRVQVLGGSPGLKTLALARKISSAIKEALAEN